MWPLYRLMLFMCVYVGIFIVILSGHIYRHSKDSEHTRITELTKIQTMNISQTKNNKNNNTRVLCLILTSLKSRAKMNSVNSTWARRCDKHLFVYGLGFNETPGVDILVVDVLERRRNLTPKIKSALIHVHKNIHDFDWILKADDDTYVIMENLKYLLSQYDPVYPGYIGCHFKPHVTGGYMSGGAGYVISAAGLRNLVDHGLTKDGACTNERGDEDVDIGRCLHDTNVSVLSSLDGRGRETFHPEPLDEHLTAPHPLWLRKFSWNEVKFGQECCSKYSISFHHVTIKNMFVYDSLLYNMEVHRNVSDNVQHLL